MVVYVLLGGALGSVARYGLSLFTYRFVSPAFPWGTLAVNLLGSLVIGFLFSLFETVVISPQTRAFIFVGILGGFTTFSSFGLETMNLFRANELRLALTNIIASNLVGIAFVFTGYIAAKVLLRYAVR